MIKQIISTFKILAVGIIFATSISYAASTWHGPTVAQKIVSGVPSDNAPKPINVGSSGSYQKMFGILSVGTSTSGVLGTNFLNVFGSAVISQNIKNEDGVSYMDNFITTALRLGVDGDVGANRYCDETGDNCIVLSDTDAGSGATVSGNIVASRICLAGDCRDTWVTPPAGGGIGFFGLSNVAFSVYHGTSCVLGIDHSVYCAGDNRWGQLGVGDKTSRLTYTSITSLGTSVNKMVGGVGNFCALLTDGTVKCWGNNDYGVLGDNTNVDKTVPTTVLTSTGVTLSSVVDIQMNRGWAYDQASGTFYPRDFACALTTTGAVYCWGYNGYGQLGDGTTAEKHSAVKIITSGASAIRVGGGNGGYACVIMTDQTIKCWGYNASAQTGSTWPENQLTPNTVKKQIGNSPPYPSLKVVDLQLAASNAAHTCVIEATSSSSTMGPVYCWGDNSYLQVSKGYDSTYNPISPVVTIPTTFIVSQIAVSAGGSTVGSNATGGYTCAVIGADGGGAVKGTVYCWGHNSSGERGLGNITAMTSSSVYSPVLISATETLGDVKQVVTSNGGYATLCALTNAGEVYCWGYNNHGQVGVGDTTQRNYTTKVSGLTGVKKINALGYSDVSSFCAILSDNTSKCWGYNAYGQLGTGNTTDSKTPIAPN